MVNTSNNQLVLSDIDSKILSVYGRVAALLLPFYAVTLPGNTILLDWVNIALIPNIAAFLIIIKSAKTNTKAYQFLRVAFGLIIFASLVATWFSPNPIDSLFAMVQEVYLFCWFLVLVFLFQDRRIAQAFIATWAIMASAGAVLHILQYFDVGPVNDYLNFSEAGHDSSRSTGFFQNPNLAANYMMSSVFILLLSPFWKSRLKLPLLFLFVFALLTTGSTGSLLALLVGGTIISWVFLRNQNIRAITLFSLVVITLVVMLIADIPILPKSIVGDLGEQIREMTVGRYFSSDGELVRSNARTRDVFWKQGLESFYQNPIGIGPNSFKEIYGISVHNDYLGFLIERGILGLLGLLFFIGVVFTRLRIIIMRVSDANAKWYSIVLFSAFLAMCIDSVLHEVFHYRQYWALLGLIFSLSSRTVLDEAPISFGNNIRGPRHNPSHNRGHNQPHNGQTVPGTSS